MKKDIKILVIGFGSIGQRHFNNLKSLGYDNVYVFDLDRKKIKDQKLKVLDLSRITLANFDIAFICNPNNQHIESAIKCAEAGLHLFIEKPLSYNLKGVKKLEKLIKKKKLIGMVACNMRFHSGIQKIKSLILDGRLGRIYSISLEFGQYLPFWRPGIDYRQNYAAKKKTGGGIVLDDIHEFDLLFWLNDFSEVEEVRILKNHISNLEIETEDQAKAIFLFKNKVLGSVSSDYLSKSYRRSCLIIGEKGNLSWNWKENRITFENENGREILFEDPQTDMNTMYLSEIKYFLNCVAERSETFNTIEKAKEVLSHLIK